MYVFMMKRGGGMGTGEQEGRGGGERKKDEVWVRNTEWGRVGR
jgi:hypothetical protein